MQVTTADLWAPAPGTLLTWEVTAAGAGTPVPLTLNQRNHLAGAAVGAPTVWLAAAFDVDGPVDAYALGRAWRAFVGRHSSLQVESALRGGTPAAYRHDPGTLAWAVTEAGRPRTVEETRVRLHELLDERCRPFGYPAFLPAAISRPDRSTIVLAMDHLHCDAYSLTVVVDEVAELYAAYAGGHDRPALPRAGCFVTSAEREHDHPVRVWHDDDRLRGWHDFLRARAFELPTFPLPLGVSPGERRPQATVVRRVADASVTERVSERARTQGASTYAATLAVLAAALHESGGPERLDVLVPVGTRDDAADRRAVGWFTTTVPLSVAADVSDAGLAAAGAAVRAGVRLGEVPLDQVLDSLPAPLVQTRADVFMVSWLDYRHLPGAARMRERAAHHVSAATLADDLQLWLSRTDDGIAVRARFPETPEARQTVGDLLDRLGARLHEVAEPVLAG